MKRIYLLLLLPLIFTSCQNGTNRQWVVANNSSTEVIVLLDAELPNYSSQTTVPAGTRETIALEEVDGDAGAGSITDRFTDMLIFNDTDSADKDFRQESNWTTTQEADGNTTNYVFTFELTDADF